MLKKQVTHWKRWQSLSTNRKIFAAILTVGTITVLAKFASVVKELALAHQFGTGEMVDAFLIAFLLPMFAINVLAGSFSMAMMPTYIRIKSNDGELAAQRLFASVLALGIFFLIVAAFILAVAAPVILPLLGSGFSAETLNLTRSLFYWLLPVIVLTGIGHLYATAINAGERFAVVALVPAVTPICAVVFLILLADRWGIHALAGGMLLGAAIELAILSRTATRRNIPLLPRWSGMTDELRVVIRQYTPMAAGAFLMSGTVLVDQAMAAMLEPGSVAALNYGNRVVAFILSISAMALGTAVLPHFSRMVSDEDWAGVRHTFRIYARLILFLSVPITVGLFLFSEPIIALLFERGAFSAADTRLVSQVQAFYLLQIPFYVLGRLGIRLISAMAKNSVLMKIAALNLVVNIIGNYLFMQYLGVAGIALSTAVVYALSFGMVYFSLFRRGIRMDGGYDR